MITFKFQGWFQCRLATDPDPADEPRGISGSTFCLPDEPDFDRIIRFHDPVNPRNLTPEIGVTITKVVSDNNVQENHHLLGAKVNLEGSPKFWGNNGIIALDGEEPIIPLIISISHQKQVLRRTLSNEEPTHPYLFYRPNSISVKGSKDKSGGFVHEASDIYEQTGIYNTNQYKMSRLEGLEKELSSTSNSEIRLGLETRIKALQEETRFSDGFGTRMHWNLQLRGPFENTIEYIHLPLPDTTGWIMQFWMGGWDSDGLCGFVNGILQLPTAQLS